MARRRRQGRGPKVDAAKRDVARTSASKAEAAGKAGKSSDKKAETAAKDAAVEAAAKPATGTPTKGKPAKGRPPAKPMPAPQYARTRTTATAFEILTDYEARSLAHVAGLPEQLDAPGLWRGVGYRIGSKRLASGFDEVGEILPMPPVTPVPGAQTWMLGVANIRGNLLPIVDLKQFLEGERTVIVESQRVLIVHQPGGDVAVTIDELYGQRSFMDAQQAPRDDDNPLVEGRYAHFIDRVYRLADDSWGVFSLERLARTPEFRQAAA